jgi:hypothetical protein
MDNRQIFCQNCGAANSMGARFCHSCGREVIVGAGAPPPPQQMYPPPQPQPMYAQPPVQQVIVQQAPAPRKGSKACAWIAAVTLLLVLCCGVGAYYFYQYMGPVQVASEGFFSDLQAQNYEQAYALCGADLQKELGSPAGLKKFIEGNDFINHKWSRSGIVRVGSGADVTYTNENSRKFMVSFMLDNANAWKVSGMSFDQ